MPHEQQSLPVLGAAGSGASQPLNSSRHLLLAAFGCVPRDSVSRLLTLFVSTAEERKFTFTCHGEPRRPHGPLGATTLHQSVWRWNQPAEEGGQPSIGTPEGIPRTAVDAAQLGWEEKGSHLPDARVETGAWPWRHGFILRTGSCSCPASLRLLFCGPLAKRYSLHHEAVGLGPQQPDLAASPSTDVMGPRLGAQKVRLTTSICHRAPSLHFQARLLHGPRETSPHALLSILTSATAPTLPVPGTRASLSCPLCPSKSHSPSQAQGPSLESTALSLRGRDGPSLRFRTLFVLRFHRWSRWSKMPAVHGDTV